MQKITLDTTQNWLRSAISAPAPTMIDDLRHGRSSTWGSLSVHPHAGGVSPVSGDLVSRSLVFQCCFFPSLIPAQYGPLCSLLYIPLLPAAVILISRSASRSSANRISRPPPQLLSAGSTSACAKHFDWRSLIRGIIRRPVGRVESVVRTVVSMSSIYTHGRTGP